MSTNVRIKEVFSDLPAIYIATVTSGDIRLRLDNSATMRLAPGPSVHERHAQLIASIPQVEQAARVVLEKGRSPIQDGDTVYLSGLDF